MTITLNDVYCLLHLPIDDELFNHLPPRPNDFFFDRYLGLKIKSRSCELTNEFLSINIVMDSK
jgi:hypothetical protein